MIHNKVAISKNDKPNKNKRSDNSSFVLYFSLWLYLKKHPQNTSKEYKIVQIVFLVQTIFP